MKGGGRDDGVGQFQVVFPADFNGFFPDGGVDFHQLAVVQKIPDTLAFLFHNAGITQQLHFSDGGKIDFALIQQVGQHGIAPQVVQGDIGIEEQFSSTHRGRVFGTGAGLPSISARRCIWPLSAVYRRVNGRGLF